MAGTGKAGRAGPGCTGQLWRLAWSTEEEEWRRETRGMGEKKRSKEHEVRGLSRKNNKEKGEVGGGDEGVYITGGRLGGLAKWRPWSESLKLHKATSCG